MGHDSREKETLFEIKFKIADTHRVHSEKTKEAAKIINMHFDYRIFIISLVE